MEHWLKVEDDGRHGIRYYAKKRMTSSGIQWFFEEQEVPLTPTAMLLVRVMIGKVEDQTQLVRVNEDSWSTQTSLTDAAAALERGPE